MSSRVSPIAIRLFSFLALMTVAAHTSPLEREGHALDRSQDACPTVSVSCPSDYKEGDALTFTATISGGNPNVVPVFNWAVSAGRIVQGQGTSSIKVDMTSFGSQRPTGTVMVSGFDSTCGKTASCSLAPIDRPFPSEKFDSYGVLPRKKEVSRLNAYAVELQKMPGSQAYILAYGGRRGRRGEAQKLAKRTQAYLVESRGIEAARIITLDGGFREKLSIDLWIVPTGATPPTAEPTDPSEVKIIQTRKRKPSKH